MFPICYSYIHKQSRGLAQYQPYQEPSQLDTLIRTNSSCTTGIRHRDKGVVSDE